MTPTLAGLLALAVPLLLFGLVFLGRNRAIFLFYVVLCAVGLGYLTTTGAVDDVGRIALDKAKEATAEKSAEPAPAAAPAPAPAPQP